jgi:hypothetical protein
MINQGISTRTLAVLLAAIALTSSGCFVEHVTPTSYEVQYADWVLWVWFLPLLGATLFFLATAFFAPLRTFWRSVQCLAFAAVSLAFLVFIVAAIPFQYVMVSHERVVIYSGVLWPFTKKYDIKTSDIERVAVSEWKGEEGDTYATLYIGMRSGKTIALNGRGGVIRPAAQYLLAINDGKLLEFLAARQAGTMPALPVQPPAAQPPAAQPHAPP